MAKKFLQLKDIGAYRISFALSNYIWKIVTNWDILAKNTVGEQIVRSADSISSNIAEGFGRYFKKDKIKFYRYSYASILESLDWNQKAKARKLITAEQYEHILKELKILPREINHLISYTDDRLKK